MPRRQNVPTPPSGGRTTTTTTTPSSGGSSRFEAPVDDAPLTSAWGRDFATRSRLRENLYRDESGAYIPMDARLFDFRTGTAQGGNVSIESILDYYVSRRDTRGRRSVPEAHSPEGRAPYGTTDNGGTTIAEQFEQMRSGGQTLTRMQKALYDAGYFDADVYTGKRKVRSGKFDELTQEAYTQALRDYVMAGGTDLGDFLGEQREALEAEGGLAGLVGAADEREALVVRLSSPEEIQNAAADTAMRLTGRRQQDFANNLVGGFQEQERAAQQRDYDLSGPSGAGGSVVVPPSAADYAESKLRSEQGAEVGAYAFLGAYNTLLQRLGLAG